jgi:hypothetical protein
MNLEPKTRNPDVTPYPPIFCAQVLAAQYFGRTPTISNSASYRKQIF